MPDSQAPQQAVVLQIEHGDVRELRLNRPPANALSPDLISALTRSLKAAQQDGVLALVLSGKPGMFSAGLDIPLALRRLVGVRQAERLGVRGLLLSPAEAAAAGLVDEVVPAEQVVTGAITWCREMLSLPRGSMSITRQQARSDLAALFERDLKDELEMVIANWCDQETQSVLRLVVERLAKKKT